MYDNEWKKTLEDIRDGIDLTNLLLARILDTLNSENPVSPSSAVRVMQLKTLRVLERMETQEDATPDSDTGT